MKPHKDLSAHTACSTVVTQAVTLHLQIGLHPVDATPVVLDVFQN